MTDLPTFVTTQNAATKDAIEHDAPDHQADAIVHFVLQWADDSPETVREVKSRLQNWWINQAGFSFAPELVEGVVVEDAVA